MRLRNIIVALCLALVVFALAAFLLGPIVVATSIRGWVAWEARQQGLTVKLGSVEAPLLRPIVIQKLRIRNREIARHDVDIEAARVTLSLNLAGLFSRSRGRVCREIAVVGLRGIFARRPNANGNRAHADWPALHDLLGDTMSASGTEIRVEDGYTVAQLRDFNLNASQLESGRFTAREFAINSPLFHQSFSQLRGATSWGSDRLTIGALTLSRGLDLDSLVIDFANLAKKRLELEFNVDAFGGKLRARISGEENARRTWDAAGTASEISLAQMSEALGLTDGAAGSLRAAKFTFRGDANDLSAATASVWLEANDVTWRHRSVQTVMLGASLYNREVQLEQLYVKQEKNECTLTGESPLPAASSDWLMPSFEGSLSATVGDLGAMAELFGGDPNSYKGEAVVNGTVSTREGKLDGELTATGKSLVIFGTPAEALNAVAKLRRNALEISELSLSRGSDFLHAHGTVEVTADHAYTGALDCSLGNIADYAGLLSGLGLPRDASGGAQVSWKGNAKSEGATGEFHAAMRHLRLDRDAMLLPLDGDFDGDYTKDQLFFRRFELRNRRASFNTYITVGRDYLQSQSLRLVVDDAPALEGNIFLPVSVKRWLESRNLLLSLGDEPIFDVDLTVAPTDLAKLAPAILTQPVLAGMIAGRLHLYGPVSSLDGDSDLQFRNVSFRDPARISVALLVSLVKGDATIRADFSANDTNALKLEMSLPVRLARHGERFLFRGAGPASAKVQISRVDLSRLPHYITSAMAFSTGSLSANLALSHSLLEPEITGTLDLEKASFRDASGLTLHAKFNGGSATFEIPHFTYDHFQTSGTGDVDFHDLEHTRGTIRPTRAIFVAQSGSEENCLSNITFSDAADPLARELEELQLRGSVLPSQWELKLREAENGTADITERMFRLCPGANAAELSLSSSPAADQH